MSRSYVLAAAVLLLAALAGGVSAFTDFPIDSTTDYCANLPQSNALAWCGLVPLATNFVADTTNKLTSADVESGVDSSDTVHDVQTAIIETDIDLSKARVAKAWSNILSLIILVVEVAQIVFFMAQIFILVHIPYFYVKLLVFMKKKAFGYAARGRSSS